MNLIIRRAPGNNVGLNESWVIGLVVVLLFLLGGVIGVAIWHSRRTRRRRSRWADAEDARASPLPYVSPYGVSLKMPPPAATSEPKRPPRQ